MTLERRAVVERSLHYCLSFVVDLRDQDIGTHTIRSDVIEQHVHRVFDVSEYTLFPCDQGWYICRLVIYIHG